MKKTAFPILILITLLLLSSCANPFDKGGVQSEGKYTKIVYDSEDMDMSEVRSAITKVIGNVPVVLYTDSPESEGEIVFGNTNRSITAAAKSALASSVADSDDKDTGYIIYSDGKSIAVYWESEMLRETAVATFKNEYAGGLGTLVPSGTVREELYSLRTLEENQYWIRLEAEGADATVIASLKKIYNYYDGDKLVDWMANLYDPEIGGFYYSISARDNNPFMPDLESTAQLINMLVAHGAIKSNEVNAVFPEEIKAKILKFAKDMQSKDDGYFYHPQWPIGKENLQTDRYGRDMGWATSLINRFDLDTDGDGQYENQYPYYCTPNGTKCALHAGGEQRCIFPISASALLDRFEEGNTTKLGLCVSSSMADIVSSVAPVASVSSTPDYSSRQAFAAWLEEYNATIKEDSGKAHNLNALKGEIDGHGYGDIVLAHLVRVQEEVFEEQLANDEEPTGLWQRNVDYKAVWGILKYMPYYNSSYGTRLDIKYVPYIVKTCIKVIGMEPDGDYEAWDLYNQWSGLTTIISNVEKNYGDDGLKIIYDLMRENASELIDNSLAKIEPFKVGDGSFSTYSTGRSPTHMYGTSISMGSAEGDVNATGLICSMYRSIYTCLGFSEVPLCGHADGERFIATISSCEPIEKPELTSGSIDFEDGMPANIKQSILTSSGKIELSEDPEDSGNTVLSFFSPVTTLQTSDSLQFVSWGSGATCYVFETRMYVSSESEGEYLFQIRVGGMYYLTLRLENGNVVIYDAGHQDRGGTWQKLATLDTDEWFFIRIEQYPPIEGVTEINTPKFKVWINDEPMIISENYYGSNDSKAPVVRYDEVLFYSMRSSKTQVYFDDCVCEKIEQSFDDTITDY